MTNDVIKTTDLKAAGLTAHAINLRCRPGGPWQRIRPGVVLLSPMPPTRAQRLRAAVTYAGPGAVLTGVHALKNHGLPVRTEPPHIHILQPASRRKSGEPDILLERTTRLPAVVLHEGLPLATPARATLDAARREQHPLRRHALLAAVVRTGLCTVEALLAELEAGSQRGTAAPRAALHLMSRTAATPPTIPEPRRPSC
jgi:hypothetical protein